MHTRKILTWGLSISLIFIFIIYAGIEARGLFYGPKISLYSPLEGSAINSAVVLIEGQTFRTKELTINGDMVLIDTGGKFSVNLVLPPGYNIITIVATDARGAQHTITRHIYFESEWFMNNMNKQEAVASSTIPMDESSTTASSSYSN